MRHGECGFGVGQTFGSRNEALAHESFRPEACIIGAEAECVMVREAVSWAATWALILSGFTYEKVKLRLIYCLFMVQ